MSTTRRLWVTGARGFMGRNVCRYFRGIGWSVVGLGRGPWSDGELAEWGIDDWRSGDVSTALLEQALDEFGAPGAVFHAAGNGLVSRSVSDPYLDFQMGVVSTLEVLEFLRRHASDATILLPSSAAIYGDAGAEPISEERTVQPISPYGLHKSMAEQLCSEYSANAGLRCVAIRYFSVYGPGLRKQLMWDVWRRARTAPHRVEVFGTGDETRDMLFVEDAAALAALLLERAEPGFSVFNGGAGRSATVAYIVENLLRPLLPDVDIRFSGEIREGDPRHMCADMARAEELGFAPRWQLTDGIQAFGRWLAQAS